MRIKDFFILPFIYVKWRIENKHNYTKLHSVIDTKRIHIGKHSYGGINVLADGNKAELYIGNYVSIGPEVLFVLESEHNYKTISTYPFHHIIPFDAEIDALSKGNITIDDDVWIGTRATIMSGVHIGQGAIIAACACVTKDVEPYSIVGGIPARLIKFRFAKEIIDKLNDLDYSKINLKSINQNIRYLQEEILDLGHAQSLVEKLNEI